MRNSGKSIWTPRVINQQNGRIVGETTMMVLAMLCATFAFAGFNVAFEDKDAKAAVLATAFVVVACILCYIGAECC